MSNLGPISVRLKKLAPTVLLAGRCQLHHEVRCGDKW
jgi:hypothetical protein